MGNVRDDADAPQDRAMPAPTPKVAFRPREIMVRKIVQVGTVTVTAEEIKRLIEAHIRQKYDLVGARLEIVEGTEGTLTDVTVEITRDE